MDQECGLFRWGRTYGGLGNGLENHAAKHLDSMRLLNLPVVSCNSFICIHCGMGNHAHFNLTLSCLPLVSPHTIIHSNHFWPQTFLFSLIEAFLTTKIFLRLVTVFPYCEYSFSAYLCQRWCSASRCHSHTFSRTENTFHFWQRSCCFSRSLPHAEIGWLDQTVLIAEWFGNLFHLQTEQIQHFVTLN